MTNGQQRWLLSGGIGSGKSVVRALLSQAGLSTIGADQLGHEILEPDGPAFDDVALRWPSVVTDGHIDRAALAEIVFNNQAQLRVLEGITHPYIFGRITRLMEEIEGVVVVEIPVMKHGLGPGWGRIVVDCDDTTRLDRLLASGVAEDDAVARMAVQPSRAEWLAVADLIVPNMGTIDELEATVDRILAAL